MKQGSLLSSLSPRSTGENGAKGNVFSRGFSWLRQSQLSPEDLRILRTVIDDGGMFVVIVDSFGRVAHFNQECERATGFGSQEVVGRPISEFLLSEDGATSLGDAFDVSDPGKFPNRLSCRFLGREGEEIPVEWHNSAIPDEDGKIKWVISTGMDVSEGAKVLQELKLFRSGIQHSGEIVFLTDPDGKIIYVNPTFEEVYRIPAELAVGETPNILNAEVQTPDVYQELWERVVLGEVYRGQMINRTGDDRLVHVENSISPVLGDDGAIVAFLAVQREVTPSRATESPGPDGGGSLFGLLDVVPLGLALLTPDGILAHANPALLELLGRPPDEVNGRPLEACLPVGDQQTFRRDILDASDRNEESSGEYLLARPVGEPTPVSVSARAMEVGDRTLTLLSFRDLSDRKRLEDRIRHAQKMQVVGQLAGGIAHDFNNLLTVVQANTELVLNAVDTGGHPKPSDTEELLEILKASRRGRGLVQKLLAFGRREDLTFSDLDLERVLLELRTPLNRLLPSSITIHLDVPPGLPPIWADEGSVEQVLLNLATNARDAMPDGGTLSVNVTRSRFPEGKASGVSGGGSLGEFLCVNVTDEGVGMDAETRDRAFEPFFTTKRVGDGAGLGMAAVYGLVKAHGGMVNLYSEVGEGTTVKVYFPVSAGTAPSREASSQSAEVDNDWSTLLRGTETILVVEHERALQKAAKKTLELVGYRVLVASDGVEGLRVFGENSEEVDLIVSDLVMPRMGGMGLFQAIKDKGFGVRFLFASGYDPETSQGERDLREALPFIEKPWTIKEFTEKVRGILDRPPPS